MSAAGPDPIFAPEPMVLAYAGFWWRVLAFVLDQVVLNLAVGLVGALTGLRHVSMGMEPGGSGPVSEVADVAWQAPLHPHWHHGGLSLVGVALAVAYHVLLESSAWQATLGKRVCRLRVTGLGGQRISPLRALGRHAGKFVSAFVLGIGFLMVAWTRRKQGLHDLMADTLVMRLRPADPVFAFRPPYR